MRKELIVYVATMERGNEFSVASVASDRNFVVINNGNGKFTASVKELRAALLALEDFDTEHNVEQIPAIPVQFEVEYGGNND